MHARLVAVLLAAAGALTQPALAQHGDQHDHQLGQTPVAKAQILPEWRDTRNDAHNAARAKLENKPAPKLDMLSGWTQTEARNWQDLRGKVVLLDLWATWCGPCIAGIPHLTEMHDQYKDDGLVILSVHVGRGVEAMDAYIKDNELPFAFAKDPNNELVKKMGVQTIPSYHFIDKNGVLRVAFANRDHLDDIAKALLAEPGPKPAEPAKESSATAASYPKPVEKQLYADDFRGKPAPKLQAETWLSAKPDTEGKVVLIDFWATWCGTCRKLIPELESFQQEFAEDLVVIGISDENAEKVKAFMNENKITYPMAVDTQARAKNAIDVKGIPHVLIVSTDGVVRWQGFPGSKEEPLTADLIRQIIDADPGVAKRHAATGG